MRYLSPRLLAACVQTSRDVLRRRAEIHQRRASRAAGQQSRHGNPKAAQHTTAAQSPKVLSSQQQSRDTKAEPNAKPQLSRFQKHQKQARGTNTAPEKKNSTLHEECTRMREREITTLLTYLPTSQEAKKPPNPPPHSSAGQRTTHSPPPPSTSSLARQLTCKTSPLPRVGYPLLPYIPIQYEPPRTRRWW